MDQYRLELYKEEYHKEFDRKSKIDSRLTLPYGIITVLFGLLANFFNRMNSSLIRFSGLMYLAGIIGFIICLAFAVCRLIRSYYGYEYRYMPNSLEQEKYYKKLDNLYENDEDKIYFFNKFLITKYCRCNKRNSIINDIRSELLHKTNNFIIAALIFSIVTMSPIAIKKFNKNAKFIYDSFNSTSKEVINSGRGRTNPTETNTSTTSKDKISKRGKEHSSKSKQEK